MNDSLLICILSRLLNAQVHISKIILNSLNLVLNFRIVTSQG